MSSLTVNTTTLPTETISPLARLIDAHFERYPVQNVMDVYRLLHHACFGTSPTRQQKNEREWLESEIGLIRTVPDHRRDILIESVHVNGDMVRLHLRPYIALGGAQKPLLDAFMSGAKTFNPDPDRLAVYMRELATLTQTGDVLSGRIAAGLNQRTVSLFSRQREHEGWSAVPHSPDYVRHYRPLYRVMPREHALHLIQAQRIDGLSV